jgi:uncharacterized membrane protein
MSLGSPQFLLLIPVLILLGWIVKRAEIWRPLRLLFIFILLVAVCDPQILLKRGGMDLWVLMDRSLSAREMVEAGEDEWRSLLERSKPGRDDRIFYVDYASEVSPTGNTETSIYSGNRDATKTGLAIRDTLARLDEQRHNRILLFTDGFSTEPLTGIAAGLIAEGTPLDHRLLRAPEAVDFRLANLEVPSRAQPAEPFLLEIEVAGTSDAEVPLSVYRGEQKLFQRPVQIRNGVGRLRFSDRIAAPGSHRYRAVIEPEIDAYSGNNHFEQWIEIVSGSRVLLLSKYREDPVASTLRRQGFEVEVVEDLLSLTPGILSGARAVVLNNVPAYEIPNDFLQALRFFVTEQGGGLVMAGGKQSFGAGGYYQSSIDDLLPVTMELKSEHRRLSVAMAIVMDRSGSMAMTTTSGNSKMQLANEGAARAVELLGQMDAVTVYAVDSQAHQVAPLLNVGKSRDELIKRIRSVESMGGGIFVYTGMKEAWSELRKAEAGQQHMILFSDAADSEEPGQYKELIKEMTDAGATISVIGLGTRSDPDASFLDDIASRGKGRMFFTDVPGDLPNIFAQETVSVARSTFVEDPVPTQSSGRWHEIAQRDLDWLPQVAGYNLSYLREEDEAAVISTDSYSAPLVAFGRRGIGKTAAVSFPLGGEFSAEVREWDGYSDFLQTLGRWIMGEEVPSGIGIKHTLTGTELTIDLLYDPAEWSEKLAKTPPLLVLQRGYRNPESDELTWERLSPGHYSVRTEVRESEPVRGAVQIGASALPFGPIVAGASAEWQFDRDRVSELRETSRTSGGGELLELTDAWRKPPAPGYEPVRNWLFLAALLLFLLEAFVTRTGWRLPFFRGREVVRKITKEEKRRSPFTGKPPSPEADSAPPPSSEPEPASREDSQNRRNRFSRAKKRQ